MGQRSRKEKIKWVPFPVEVLGFNYCVYGNAYEFILCAALILKSQAVRIWLMSSGMGVVNFHFIQPHKLCEGFGARRVKESLSMESITGRKSQTTITAKTFPDPARSRYIIL